MAKGHNFYGGLSAEHLKQFIERIENLDRAKQDIADDIKSIFAEAKATGFEPKIMKNMIKLRKMDSQDRETFDNLMDTYRMALGLTPPDLFNEDGNPSAKENDVKVNITIGEHTFEDVDLDKFNKTVNKLAN
jgi:uncharacterized protein (UPF0335 family)